MSEGQRIGGLPVLWLLLFILWLIVNASLATPILVTGAIISFAIAWIFARRSKVWHIAVTPRSAWHFLAYTGIFFTELVKANLSMLRYVYAPRIDIHPGIVKVRIRLKSPIGRLALSNSIALTPGSLVMDVRGETMFVHWLDVKATDPEQATEMIVAPFEKHLEAVFG
ncbi:MAG: Na+/H+ antiporter subunit E [Proteobacteria bacterium]|nr:Na+/H+ antiporter subunit E [Pseudomonadota bacterium]